MCATSVCRRWRCVAIDRAVLWGTVCWDSEYESSLALLDTFLQRSKGAPLTINIHISENGRFESLQQMLYAILPHIERYYELCIGGDHSGTLYLLTALTPSPETRPVFLQAPKLHRLRLAPRTMFIRNLPGVDTCMVLACNSLPADIQRCASLEKLALHCILRYFPLFNLPALRHISWRCPILESTKVPEGLLSPQSWSNITCNSATCPTAYPLCHS